MQAYFDGYVLIVSNKTKKQWCAYKSCWRKKVAWVMSDRAHIALLPRGGGASSTHRVRRTLGIE